MLIITNYYSFIITSLGPGSASWENGEKIGQVRLAERVWGGKRR